MISMSKKYRYRNGDSARVLCTDRKNLDYPVVSMSENGLIRYHNKYGSINTKNAAQADKFDLIEIRPYDDFRNGDIVKLLTEDDAVIYREWYGVSPEGDLLCYNNFWRVYRIDPDIATISLVCRKKNRKS